MLLLLSKQANSSPQIRREVERAVNRSIIIIPVRLEDVMPARSLEFFLSTSHWMDAFPPPFENHLENLSTFNDARSTPLTELFAGTPVGNIAMAALTNTQSVRQLIITSTGMIEIREEPEDTGTYSFARGYLTLISSRSQRSDRYQYKLSVANAAIPLVMAGPGDGLLDLTGFSNYPTRWVRKGDGNPESLVGFWKTPLLTFVTGSHIVFLYTPGTFEFKADQTYVLHLTRTQTGILEVLSQHNPRLRLGKANPIRQNRHPELYQKKRPRRLDGEEQIR